MIKEVILVFASVMCFSKENIQDDNKVKKAMQIALKLAPRLNSYQLAYTDKLHNV